MGWGLFVEPHAVRGTPTTQGPAARPAGPASPIHPARPLKLTPTETLVSHRMSNPVTKNQWRAVDPLPKSGLVYLGFPYYDPRNYGVSSMVSTLEQAMALWGMGDYLDVDEKIIYRPTKRGYLLGFKGASAWRF